MPPKHTRAESDAVVDHDLARRRALTAARVRAYRDRQRAGTTQRTPVTQAQLQQGEVIIQLDFLNEDAPPTQSQVGLRVQDLTLAQDAGDALLLQDTLPIDEHSSLYHAPDPSVEPDAASDASSSSNDSEPSPLRGLNQFFPTLPPTNLYRSARPSLPSSSSVPSRPEPGSDRPLHPSPRSEPASNEPSHRSPQPTTIHATVIDDSEDDAIGVDTFHPETDEAGSVTSAGREDYQHAVGSLSPNNEPIFEEEELPHEPPSEPSAASSAFSEVEMTPLEYTVDKLCHQLQDAFHGCTDEQHEEDLERHEALVGDNHHGLEQVFNDRDFPSVLKLEGFITAERLNRQIPVTAEQWQAMFCGIPEETESATPQPVCLHTEETQALEPQVAFDVDSFLGFASSLAVARQGIWYDPAPQQRQNIATDIHVNSTVYSQPTEAGGPSQARQTMLKKIPHFHVGRVEGARDITIYILFPHMLYRGDTFMALNHEQLRRWFDQIFNPALHRHCPAHYVQHLPASHRHALANSTARQVESRMIETASYQATQSITYHLQPESLQAIWDDIRQTIVRTPRLQDFREPQLFFSAKGTKLQFKTNPSRPTLLNAMDNFEAYFERVMDWDFVYLDRFYVDLGKEICPPVSHGPRSRRQLREEDNEAQVYLWKRCCLRRNLAWLYDGEPPALNGEGQRLYEMNMLHEAATLTSLTPRRSRLRSGGLIYSQYYMSVKEVWDASKCFPFMNDGLEELALDPLILQGARSLAGGRYRASKIIENAYCASKRRTHAALEDSHAKSFGTREEHRITWGLFRALAEQLRRRAEHEELEILLDGCPSHTWAVRTHVYLHFLYRSVDKFAAGFEVARARCREDYVTWEQTKIMAMFLRGLRFVLGGHQLARESALWWSRRERSIEGSREVRVWYGLGLGNTVPRYGYGWLEPRVDWARLVFRPEVTDEMLFGNDVLRGQYLRRGGRVRGFFDTTRRLEVAIEFLQRYHAAPRIRNLLLVWMVHICLQQFRIDVLDTARKEIEEERREEAREGMEHFNYDYFDRIMVQEISVVSGNHALFQEPLALARYLFNSDDGLSRKVWDHRPYRKLYRRTRNALTANHGDTGYCETFTRRLFRHLFAYHWILPYPCPEALTQTNKDGGRMWYSIAPRNRVEGRSLESHPAHEWMWMRKQYYDQPGPPLPFWMDWSKEEWQESINQEIRRAGDRVDA